MRCRDASTRFYFLTAIVIAIDSIGICYWVKPSMGTSSFTDVNFHVSCGGKLRSICLNLFFNRSILLGPNPSISAHSFSKPIANCNRGHYQNNSPTIEF